MKEPADIEAITIMKEPADIEAITIGILRGEVALDKLSEIGIDISCEDGFFRIESGNFDVAVTPTPFDLALGLLRYTSRKKDELRKWAFFLLGECGAIDLTKIESHPQGELLINALWEASFGGSIKREALVLAEKLAVA